MASEPENVEAEELKAAAKSRVARPPFIAEGGANVLVNSELLARALNEPVHSTYQNLGCRISNYEKGLIEATVEKLKDPTGKEEALAEKARATAEAPFREALGKGTDADSESGKRKHNKEKKSSKTALFDDDTVIKVCELPFKAPQSQERVNPAGARTLASPSVEASDGMHDADLCVSESREVDDDVEHNYIVQEPPTTAADGD